MSGYISGALGDVSKIVGGVSSVASTASNAASLISSLSSGGYGAKQGLGIWAATLQAASFRGVPFGVFEARVRTGRRTATHIYPYRNEVWVEDLGLGTHAFMFRGFLVGDDVYAQRDKMVAAVETAGPGVLIHPSLGSRNVSIVDFSANERAEEGRVVELEMTFIQTVNPVTPATVAQTKKGVLASVEKGISAAEKDFQKYIEGPLNYGLSIVQKVTSTVSVWERAASGLMNDAKMMAGSVRGMLGPYGLFAHGSLEKASVRAATNTLLSAATLGSAALGAATANAASTQSLTATAIADAVANKQAVSAAIQNLSLTGKNITAPTASSFIGSAYSVTEAIRALAVDPADQVRLLTELLNYATNSMQVAPAPTPISVNSDAAKGLLAELLSGSTPSTAMPIQVAAIEPKRPAKFAQKDGLSTGLPQTVYRPLSFGQEGNYLTVNVGDQESLLDISLDLNAAIQGQVSPLDAASNTAQIQTIAALRWCTIFSLAAACQDYQATSSNDALSLMSSVVMRIDNEITIVGDAGQDNIYAALLGLRAAVTRDLITRAAQLPSIRTVSTNEPMPSLCMAYTLYLDATRAPELSVRAGAAHPGFMPTQFEALSS